jgi:hypothetical protein
MTRRVRMVTTVIAGAAIVALFPSLTQAQARVIVPILVPTPPAAASSAGPSSIHVTTRTVSPRSGVTTTEVTVRDTTGAVRRVGPAAGSQLATAPVGTRAVLVTVERRTGPDGAGPAGTTSVTVEDVSHASRVVGGPAPLATLRTASPGQETVTLTSEAPIDAPIVILAP